MLRRDGIQCKLGAAILYLSAPALGLASVDICQDPQADTHFTVRYDTFGKGTLDNGRGTLEQDRLDGDFLLRPAGASYFFGAGHRYSIFNFEPDQPQTNGHLHTFFLPLHYLAQDDRRSFRVSVAPALSASSNVMQDLNEYADDALQLLAALVWGRQLSARTSLRYGLCGDHRFGEYRVYPLVSIQLQPHPDWVVRLGFPVSQFTYQLSGPLRTTVRLGPDGNEWYVQNRPLTADARFVYVSYALTWAFDWQFHDDFSLTLSAGRQFDQRIELTLADNSRVSFASNPVNRFGAALAWRF